MKNKNKTIICRSCCQKADIEEKWEYFCMGYEIKHRYCSECKAPLVNSFDYKRLFHGLTIEEYINSSVA